jgi:hypothetical protein
MFVTPLVRALGRVGCLKVSPTSSWADGAAPACRLEGADFYLENAEGLRRAGKDTAIYLSAGAVQVERLRHRRAGLAAGLEAALDEFPPELPVIVESSSAIAHLRPVAIVLVVRPPLQEMKPSTAAVLPRVTDLLVNGFERSAVVAAATERLHRDFESLRPSFTWHVDLPSEPLPSALVCRMRELLECPPAR